MAIEKFKTVIDIVPRLEEKYFPKPVPARVENLRKNRDQGVPERLERDNPAPAVDKTADDRSVNRSVAEVRETEEFGRKLENEIRKVDGMDRTEAPTETGRAETSPGVSDPKTLDDIEKAIKAQAAKVINLLKKLGIDISPETAASFSFIKRILKIAGDFLAGASDEGAANIQMILKDALESLKNLSNKIQVKPDEVTGLFQELSAGLEALESLLALKDKLLKGDELNGEELALLETLSPDPAPAPAIPEGLPVDTPVDNAIPTDEAPVSDNGDAPVEETTPAAKDEKTEPMQAAATTTPAPPQTVGDKTTPVAATQVEAAPAVTTEAFETKPEAVTPEMIPVEAQPVQETPVAAALQTQPLPLPMKGKHHKAQETASAEKPVATAIVESKPSEAVKVTLEPDAGKPETTPQNPQAGLEFTSGQDQSDGSAPDMPAISSDAKELTETPVQPEKNLFIKTLSDLREAALQPQASVRPSAVAFEAPVHQARYTSQNNPASERAVVQQITSKFQLFTGQHGSEIRIQLKPEHLGQVKISIEIDREVVVTRMQVESEKVRHIVENNVQTLKSSLEEQGIKVERFEVTVNQGRDDFFRRDADPAQHRTPGRVRFNHYAGAVAGAANGADSEASETGRRYGWNTVEYLG